MILDGRSQIEQDDLLAAIKEREADALDIQYKALGKDLWERREEIKTALFEKRAEKNGNDVVVREIISGALPLFLVQDYFAEIEQHKKDLESKKIDALRFSILEDIEREISKFLKSEKTDSKLAKNLSDHIKTKKQSLTSQGAPGVLVVEGRDFDTFDRKILEDEIKEAVGLLDKAIKMGHLIDEQVDDLATEEGSIPDSGEVKELTEKQTEINGILTKAKMCLEKVDDDLNLARGRIEKAEKEIDSLSQQALEMNIEGDKQEKYLSRLDSANAILQTFSEKIITSLVTTEPNSCWGRGHVVAAVVTTINLNYRRLCYDTRTTYFTNSSRNGAFRTLWRSHSTSRA